MRDGKKITAKKIWKKMWKSNEKRQIKKKDRLKWNKIVEKTTKAVRYITSLETLYYPVTYVCYFWDLFITVTRLFLSTLIDLNNSF